MRRLALFFPFLLPGLFGQTPAVPYDPIVGPTFTNRQFRFQYPGSYPSLRNMNFRDFTFFQNFDAEGKPAGSVALKNGHFGHDEPGDRYLVDLESTYYLGSSAPLHQESALVLFSWFAAGGSSSQGGIAQVFTLSDGHLRVTQEMNWDTHFPTVQPTDSFDASTRTLLFRSAHYMPGDARCCVSAMDVVTLKWDGTRFVQTGLQTEPSEYGKGQGKKLLR